METDKVPTLEELKQLRKPIINVTEKKKESLTRLETFAFWITRHVGSMGFFIIIFIWTMIWLAWNTFAPDSLKFDPFPAFVLWLFISNMIQLSLLPLIMVGQNVESRSSEIRAQADYEVNEKAEREIETIIAHLENQNKMLEEIQKKLEK